MQQSNVNVATLPKTPEELDKFRQEYPDVYDVVQTIASTKQRTKIKDFKKNSRL